MSIRAKIVLIVLPLIIAPLLITGYVSSLSARNGITRVATSLLRFKQEELLSYASSQWSLLVSNNLVGNEEFVEASKDAVQSFARNMVRSGTELILAVDAGGNLVMATGEIELTAAETQVVQALLTEEAFGWQQLALGGSERVAQVAPFEAFGWYILVTEQREAFYQTINQMYLQTGIILSVSSALALALLLVFSYLLTQPLKNVVGAMRDIISTSDLSKRVEVLYNDETGELGHTFNLMTSELDKANDLMKGYALQAVVAQHKEQKIRNIFQKYVPKAVIDQFFASPERMLVGEDRILALLFSDIRGFTTISERMRPNEVVESLNAYFELMVDIIMRNRGVVDKYMGDAIMAFYGAPERTRHEASEAIRSAFEMLEALKDFNVWQTQRGRPEFRIGIGINYGVVTVGNIGSEKKMDYTVIGDMVNIGSRLEGLTKVYDQPIIISESVAKKIEEQFPCRLIDRVIVKGKTAGIGIYTSRKELSPEEQHAWQLHEEAARLFYERSFEDAARLFQKVQELLPGDRSSAMFLERSKSNIASPHPPDWTGAMAMTVK
ncbi:MAG: HAMP domain-containing protein [Spirochaetales bacterium]|nr:HAMP domain-containing protein [Spirochaetales bacterium]